MDREPPGPASDRYPRAQQDAELVSQLRAGDRDAFGVLYDAWFDRVHDLSLRIVRDERIAEEVSQDAFLTVWQQIDRLEKPEAFGGWLLRIARNRSLNRLEKERRSTSVGDDTMAAVERAGSPVSAPVGFAVEERLRRADDPEIAVEDGELVSLVWGAADALGERDRTVLDLQLRHGMTPAEIGDVVGVNRNAANQLVHRVKGRLDTAVQARVLWDGDDAACGVLRRELTAQQISEFDAGAVQVAARHAETCAYCGERRQLRLRPAALFGAIPILVAPQLLKVKVAAALESAGVPMHGSASGGSGSELFADPDATVVDAARPGGADAGAVGVVTATAGIASTTRTRRSPSRRALRAILLAAAVLVILAGMTFVLADDAGDGGEHLAVEDTAPTIFTSTSISATSSTTTEPPAPSTTLVPTTDAPVVVVPPTEPPLAATTTTMPTTSTTVALEMALDVSPAEASNGYDISLEGAPVVTWSVAGAASARVSGPNVAAETLSGSMVVCPGSLDGLQCYSDLGSHDYLLEAFDANGRLVGESTATLSVSY